MSMTELTNTQIAEKLLSDVDTYNEYIKNLIVGGLSTSPNESVYWDAWYRGARGEDLEKAEKGIVYNPKKSELKRQYNSLADEIISMLKDEVNASGEYSKHSNTKCIKVKLFNYTELVIVDYDLAFLDSEGYRYDVWDNCKLEDLMGILNNNNI